MRAERMTPLLAILLGLFVGRVLGQLLVSLWEPSFLPPFEQWQSGTISYPSLLAIQCLLIFAGAHVLRRAQAQSLPKRPLWGYGLVLLSSVYAACTLLRAISYLAYLHGIIATPVMPAWVPIPFHFVIAGFILVTGQLLLRCERRTLSLLPLLFLLHGCALPSYYLETQTSLAPATNRFVTEEHFSLPTADRILLRGRVYRPMFKEKVPSILIRAPFPDGPKTEAMVQGIGRLWARRGYAVVVQGTRGTLGSEGSVDELFVHERADGLSLLAWVEQQPFYNGRLFTWGGSYFAYTQWALADDPRIDGMISQIGSDDFYPVLHPGNTFALESGLFWALRRGWTLPPPQTVAAEAAQWPTIPTAAASFLEEWKHHRTDETYWQKRRAIPASESAAPALIMGGWFDPFLEQQIAQYRQLRASSVARVSRNSRLVVGPWTHAASVAMPEGVLPRSYRIASIQPAIEWFAM
ncbi:MAG: CocE/NonD family hydrolase, partial [Bdellovibrionales bacterium]|nr:CocE/NonD family hydrolase [Bdellovibrionales bacterium]